MDPVSGATIVLDFPGTIRAGFMLLPNGDLLTVGAYYDQISADKFELTYEITDSNGATSTGTIGINDDPPVANDDTLNPISADSPPIVLNQQMLANDTDPEGDPIAITGDLKHGNASLRHKRRPDHGTRSGHRNHDRSPGHRHRRLYRAGGESRCPG